MKYDFKTVEAKCQKVWEDEKTFHAEIDHTKPKFYALVEFPYPSGAGLHVGHPRSYTALADNQGAFSLDTANPGFLAPPGLPLSQAGLVELIHTGADGHRSILAAVPRITVFLPRLAKKQ